MELEEEKKWRKSGEILEKTRQFILPQIKEGSKLLEIGNLVENKIIELGGMPGFPVNISLNDMAAHDIPDFNDERVFSNGDVVKLDIGVHFDGYVADSAVTIVVGDNDVGEQLIKVNKKALDEAIKLFVPGQKLSEISGVIEDVIRSEGFNPVANLSGHRVTRWSVHESPNVANIRTDNPYVLKKGDVFACEPFVTDGRGYVNEIDRTQIYSFIGSNNIRLPEGRKILKLAKEDYSGLPFAARWLIRDGISALKTKMALQQLVQVNSLRSYPALKEATGGLVSQMEHTIIVNDKPIVFTRDV